MEVLFFSLLLFVFLLFGFVFYKSYSIWLYVKASKLNINIFEFLFHFIGMWIRGIPISLTFNLRVSAKKSGASISFKFLKDFYMLIRRTVEPTIIEFNKTESDRELILKRVAGLFILSGTTSELIKKITVANIANKPPLILGIKKSKAEKLKHEYINNKINEYQKILAEIKDVSLVDFEKIDKPKKKKKSEFQNIIKKSIETQNQELAEKIIKYHTTELQTELKSYDIYMSKGSDFKLFKNKLFESISNALIKGQQAGFKVQFDDLEVHFGTNGDIEATIMYLIDAKKIGLSLEFKELEKYLLLGGNISEVIKALTRLYQEGINDITLKDLSEFLSQGGKIQSVVNSIIKLRQSEIDVSLEKLNEFRIAGADIDNITGALLKAKQAKINIPVEKLQSFLAQDGDVSNLVNVLVKTKSANLNLTLENYVALFRIGANINKVYVAFKIAKLSGIENAEKEKLIEIQTAGGEMFDYVKVLSIAKRLELKISSGGLEADVIDGRNVVKVIFAVLYARNQKIKFDYEKAIRHDREGRDVSEIVSWAVNPQVINIEPEKILSKDGVEMKLFTNVTVKGKINLYLRGTRNDVLSSRVNEAVIKEVERYLSYKDVLESLNVIAYRVYKRLIGKINPKDFYELAENEMEDANKKEIKLNESSAYEILDINIPNLEIGDDAYAEIKKEHAEINKVIAETESEKRQALAKAQELEAKAKLIEAEAKLNEGMAHAFKKGRMDTKEYHKHKIFKDEDLLKDSELPKGH